MEILSEFHTITQVASNIRNCFSNESSKSRSLEGGTPSEGLREDFLVSPGFCSSRNSFQQLGNSTVADAVFISMGDFSRELDGATRQKNHDYKLGTFNLVPVLIGEEKGPDTELFFLHYVSEFKST